MVRKHLMIKIEELFYSYFSQSYLYESEHNSVTDVQTRLPRSST